MNRKFNGSREGTREREGVGMRESEKKRLN